MYVLVATFAAVLTAALLAEYHFNTSLLNQSKQLFEQKVQTRMIQRLSLLQEQYPKDRAELLQNWQQYPLDFYLYDNQTLLFPAAWLTTDSEQNNQIWQTYMPPARGANNLPERAKIIAGLKQAIQENNTELQNSLSRQFVSHLQYFQLSAFEEVVSRLAFVDIDDSSNWNEHLLRTLIFDGTGNVKPLIYFLYYDNEGISENEYSKVYQRLSAFIESTTLNESLLAQLHRFFDQATPENSILTATPGTFIFKNQIAFQTGNNLLQVNYSASELTTYLSESLAAEHELSAGDTIEFFQLPVAASEMKLNIARQSQQDAQTTLRAGLIVKLIFVILFSFCLAIMLRYFRARQQLIESQLLQRQSFINFVGHELRTPLASIRLMSETLLKRSERNLPIKDYPERIVNEADKLNLMVENLLSMQKLDNQTQTLELHQCALEPLITRECELAVENKRMDLHYEVAVNGAHLALDSNLFSLVLRNIIDNAIKYADKQTVTVSFSMPNQNELLISDNAKGMTDQSESLFADFRQSCATNQGFGLGLSLSKKIMKLHRGDIEIASTSPAGTVWRLSFNEQ